MYEETKESQSSQVGHCFCRAHYGAESREQIHLQLVLHSPLFCFLFPSLSLSIITKALSVHRACSDRKVCITLICVCDFRLQVVLTIDFSLFDCLYDIMC